MAKSISWNRSDIEHIFFFPSGLFTQVNLVFSLIIGLMFGVAFYSALFFFKENYIFQMFYERGTVPYVTILLGGWALAILLIKMHKLKVQKKAIRAEIFAENLSLILSPDTAEIFIKGLHDKCQDPDRFVLFKRILRALSSLKNIGRVSDIDQILKTQSENDFNVMESSYNVIRGFVWAIPVLGFIGTVVGLSQAIGGFGSVLAAGSDMKEVVQSLKGVTVGLSVAFDTTWIALVLALSIQMLITFVRNKEEMFLLECDDYCHRHVTLRLRSLPFQNED